MNLLNKIIREKLKNTITKKELWIFIQLNIFVIFLNFRVVVIKKKNKRTTAALIFK